MPFDNHSSLLTAVASNWMHRADLAAVTEDFVDLFESDFNSAMRLRQMEQSTSISSTAGYLVHPAQWREWKQVTLSANGRKYNLTPITEEANAIVLGGESTGQPRYYKVRNTKTYLYPVPSTNYVVDTVYYEGVTSLSTSQSSNWVLAGYPGAYLYGALEQAVPYVGDDPRVPLWVAAKNRVLQQMVRESNNSEYGRQVLQMKVDTDK